VLAGVAAAAALTPLLMRALFGAPSSNASSFVAAGVAMAAASAVACWGPARRALAIEPAAALRSE
jgi:ABC-type antimicrobial peptide transport system permease subunit